MSKDFSTDQLLLERPSVELNPVRTQPVPTQPLPTQDYAADHLMDEIFGDVERVLDNSLVPPSEPLPVEPDPAQINFDLAAMLATRFPQADVAETAPITPPAPARELRPRRAAGMSVIERLMIFTGCASALAAIGIWLISQGILGRAITALQQQTATPAPVATLPQASPADAQFSDYVQRSLETIDRTAAANPAATLATVPVPATPGPPGAKANLPGIAVPGGAAKLPTLPSVINLPAAKVSVINQQSAQPAQPVDNVTRNEFNQLLTRVANVLERISPGSSGRLPAGIASNPRTAPDRATAAKPAAPVAPVGPQRTLTTALEMGQQSAVLLEMNGVTQRVYLGESVGSSGWSLIDVSKGAATFRRNGEVKTMSAGEKL
jgi:hypothetical protein